jgi:hypothetical protein
MLNNQGSLTHLLQFTVLLLLLTPHNRTNQGDGLMSEYKSCSCLCKQAVAILTWCSLAFTCASTIQVRSYGVRIEYTAAVFPVQNKGTLQEPCVYR